MRPFSSFDTTSDGAHTQSFNLQHFGNSVYFLKVTTEHNHRALICSYKRLQLSKLSASHLVALSLIIEHIAPANLMQLSDLCDLEGRCHKLTSPKFADQVLLKLFIHLALSPSQLDKLLNDA